MNLFTSSSEVVDTPKRHGTYVLITLATVLVGLLLLEMLVRNTDHDPTQRYILGIMSETSPNIQIGDSHAGGSWSAIPGYAFMGRGGLSPVELEAILRYSIRHREVGKVLLVVGPNSFARDRQAGWRVIPEGTFDLQWVPFPILLLEPAFRSGLSERIKSLFSIEARAQELTRSEAVDIWTETSERHGDAFHIGMVSKEVEFLLTEGRYSTQNPVPDFEQSNAFTAFERLVAWLDEVGTSTCIVDTPLTPMYREVIAAKGDDSRFYEARQAIAGVANRHGFRFASGEILASDWGEELFANQDHLNARGHALWWPMVDEYCFG